MSAEDDARAEATPMPGKSLPLAVVLAWLVPGLGHAYLGWWKRAILYAAIIFFMFGFGLKLEGGLSRPQPGALLSKLATVADMGVGPAYFACRAKGIGVGRVSAATHEIGNAFHWSAGVMNMLLMLDAYDIVVGRKRRNAPAPAKEAAA